MGVFTKATDGNGYIMGARVTAGAMLRVRAARARFDGAARQARREPCRSETEFLAWVLNSTTAKLACASDDDVRRMVERWRPLASGAAPEAAPEAPATATALPVVRDGGTARARLGVSTRAPTEQQAGATPEGYHEIEDLA